MLGGPDDFERAHEAEAWKRVPLAAQSLSELAEETRGHKKAQRPRLVQQKLGRGFRRREEVLHSVIREASGRRIFLWKRQTQRVGRLGFWSHIHDNHDAVTRQQAGYDRSGSSEACESL